MSNANDNAANEKSLLLNIGKVSQTVNSEDFQAVVSILDNEIGNRKLNREELEQLQTIMNVDALEAAKWKSVADVLRYVSLFAIAENNPEAMKKITEVILGIVGYFYPIANTAQGLLTKVPDKLFSVLIKIGGLASPEYLIYRGASAIANQKSEKAKEQAGCDISAHESVSNLIIVCKSKLLSEEMDRLIKLKDDVDEETVVGTKDETVHTIIWNEAAWEAFQDKLTNSDKVLIIGGIKNTLPLTSEQIRFDKFGVKYGWNNNIAMIEADPKVLSNADDYNEFLSVVNNLQISEKQKKNAKFKFDWRTAGKMVVFPPVLIRDLLWEDTAVRKQQLLFGLYNLYMQDLAEFLEPQEALSACV